MLIAGIYSATGLVQNYWDNSNTLGSQSNFTLNFKFTRIGFPAGQYSGGQCDLPYTEFTEDSATLSHIGKGVRGTVNCRITAVTLQFDQMAGNATAYIKKNGVVTDLGIVTSGTNWATFVPVGYTVNAGDEVLAGFYSASTGSFTYPTATVFIREV